MTLKPVSLVTGRPNIIFYIFKSLAHHHILAVIVPILTPKTRSLTRSTRAFLRTWMRTIRRSAESDDPTVRRRGATPTYKCLGRIEELRKTRRLVIPSRSYSGRGAGPNIQHSQQ